MTDIQSKEDIQNLVDLFYGKVLVDSLLAPFFAAMNFEAHKPRMVNFWSFVLLDEAGYTTDVTQKHMRMRLNKEHFDQWLSLFNTTVDEHFEGPKAEAAKQRALLVGWTIQSKLEHARSKES
ncbi:MAG: hemoglobin [Crocinitomicaceae bacterium]|jgi:hemoglobin